MLILVAFSALWGVMKGFVKLFFPLLGLIVGILLAGKLYAPLAERVFGSEAAMAKVGAFALMVAIVVFIASTFAWMLSKALSLVMLGWLDRMAGGVLGLAIGGIAIGAILALVGKFSLLGLVSAVADSTLAAFLLERFPVVLSLLPQEFDTIRSFFR